MSVLLKGDYSKTCSELDRLKKKRADLDRQIDALEREKQRIIYENVPSSYSNYRADGKPWEQPRVRFFGVGE